MKVLVDSKWQGRIFGLVIVLLLFGAILSPVWLTQRLKEGEFYKPHTDFSPHTDFPVSPEYLSKYEDIFFRCLVRVVSNDVNVVHECHEVAHIYAMKWVQINSRAVVNTTKPNVQNHKR